MEISVTTTDQWESHNVEKCLAAGYDLVMVCSGDLKNLEKIRGQLAGRLAKSAQDKIMALEPSEVILFLDKQIAQESKVEKVVKGYRVKVEYDK